MSKANKTSTQKCTVLDRTLTIEEAEQILNNQRDNLNSYLCDNKESAFKKALTGSKRYLTHKGLI